MAYSFCNLLALLVFYRPRVPEVPQNEKMCTKISHTGGGLLAVRSTRTQY